ncbi:AimR family lysis-lysogeny pheromone receptor [Bacillus horti]|uniref:Transcriptional regulator with XRE-family HTH domain n=1 Tax=Caldalkalibacillus horti TaxID=77523 RepID=A0ABT9W070_9BACI|nr:AimR family lysis-lysogeny pheromone receptor [Bacillus horti]MDQ0166656.1 transcriptional regulator with XRE-family HTH domain [Bacillus horti]
MLRERILQTLKEQKKLGQRQLAHISGLSESSTSRFLHGYEDINFEAALKLIKYLYPKEETALMTEYILSQKTRNARFALEYCLLNQLYAPFTIVLERLSSSLNHMDKEWAGMYHLVQLRKDRETDPIELLQQVEIFKPKELEMQVLKGLLKAYIYIELEEKQSVLLHIKNTDKLIKKIKSSFMRNAFKIRLGFIMSTITMYARHSEKLRAYTRAIIEQDYFENAKIRAYHLLGYSYMYDDYQEALIHFNRALEGYKHLSDSVHIKEVEQLISYMNSYWKIEQKPPRNIENEHDFTNYIYHFIRTDNKNIAETLLSSLNVDKLCTREKAFYWYYKGLISEDAEHYYLSIDHFLSMNDYFHLRLPVEELSRLEENNEILKVLLRRKPTEELVDVFG